MGGEEYPGKWQWARNPEVQHTLDRLDTLAIRMGLLSRDVSCTHRLEVTSARGYGPNGTYHCASAYKDDTVFLVEDLFFVAFESKVKPLYKEPFTIEYETSALKSFFQSPIRGQTLPLKLPMCHLWGAKILQRHWVPRGMKIDDDTYDTLVEEGVIPSE